MVHNLENSYIDVVRGKLTQLGDDLLIEDIDVLCRYIVLRFLRASPKVVDSSTTEEVIEYLEGFVSDIYPFMVTFISVVNSSPLAGTNEA